MSHETQTTIATALILAGMALLLFCAAVSCTPLENRERLCPLPPSDTASVVYERKLDECLDVVRLCAIVVRQYEDGATVCRGD